MRTRTITSLLFVSALVASVFAGAKEEIQSLYKKLEKAIMMKDLKTIGWTAAPDFKWKNTDGTVQNKAQVLAQLKQQFAMTKKITQCQFKIEDWKIMGDKAVVMSSFKITADVWGEDKKIHKLVNWGKNTDNLRKTKDGWKCYMVVETSDETTIDGKPVPMMKSKK